MTIKRNSLFVVLVVAATSLFAGCAAKRPSTETPSSARLKDGVPERRASQRSATPGLQLEQEDERWGNDAAREVKENRDAKKARERQRREAATPAAPGSFAPTLAPSATPGAPPVDSPR